MSDVANRIKELLLDDSLKHSLAKEAMANILKENADLTEDNDGHESHRITLDLKIKKLEDEKRALQGAVIKWTDAEKSIKAREVAVTKKETDQMRAEMALSYEQLRVGDGKEVLRLLLRNRVVNETILSDKPMMNPGQLPHTDQWGNANPGMVPFAETHTTSKETKTEEE